MRMELVEIKEAQCFLGTVKLTLNDTINFDS